MEKSKDRMVVVLTRNYSTGLSVIRSLGSLGYTIDVVASAQRKGKSALASSSRFVRNSVEEVTKKVKEGGDEELLADLMKYEGQCDLMPILFPTDDYTASIMDENRDRLENIFLMPGIKGGGKGSLTGMMNKTVQSRLAREAGILTPMEWIISLRDEEPLIPKDMMYPCFVKPVESISGYKREMKACSDEMELKAHLGYLQERFPDRDILVQEYIDSDGEINIGGLCVDQEIVIPAIIRKQRVAGYETGVAITGKLCPMEELGELAPKIENMMKSYAYIGMFDIDFLISGDNVYFSEVNLRSGGSNNAYYMSGVNLAELCIRGLLGEPLAEEDKKVREYGRTFIYETVAWEEYLSGYMTREELDELYATTDIQLIYSEDDPAPGEFFREEVSRREESKLQKKAAAEELAEKLGWTVDETMLKLNVARKGLGISYKEYIKHEFWKLTEEEQEAKASEILQKKEEKRRNREEAVQAVMEGTGCTEEEAGNLLDFAREKYGISNKDYVKNELWCLPEEEQKEKALAIIEKRERQRRNRETCIENAMKKAGWSREEAAANIKDARQRLGITYRDYDTFEFCLIPVKKQEKAYQKIMKKKQKQ